jgi:cytochrome c-type biogenesis protein CcmH/NrfG
MGKGKKFPPNTGTGVFLYCPFPTGISGMDSTPGRNAFQGGYSGSLAAAVLMVLLVLAAAPAASPPTGIRERYDDGKEFPPDIVAALRQLETAARRAPGDGAVWISLGNLYFDMYRYEQAVAAYEQALRSDPRNPDVLTDLGVMYLYVDQVFKALVAFDKAISIRPEQETALLNKGFALLDLGRETDARESWLRLLRLNPKAVLRDGTPLAVLLRDMEQR